MNTNEHEGDGQKRLQARSRSHYARAAVVFAACMAFVFTLPYLGLLLRNGFIFFANQFLFPYDAFVIREEFGSRAVFSHPVALTLTILQWSLTGLIYVGFARRLSIGRAIIVALVTIAAVGFVTVALFGLFGVSLELDGL